MGITGDYIVELDDIRVALSRLNPENLEHWTIDGLPKVDEISNRLCEEVTRQQITEADPEFNRAKARKMKADGIKFEKEKAEKEPPLAPEPPKKHYLPDNAVVNVVEPRDDVVGMAPKAVYSDRRLVRRAIDEFSRQYELLRKRRDSLTEQLDILSKRIEVASKVFSRFKEVRESPIRDYLEQARKTREEKANRARRFIEAGTSADEVRDAVDSRAKIDRAMNARKAVPGSTRPAHPMRG